MRLMALSAKTSEKALRRLLTKASMAWQNASMPVSAVSRYGIVIVSS